MTHIANFVANFYSGIKCKRIRFKCFRTSYIFSILNKLYNHGFCRGNSWNAFKYKKNFHQVVELKYDFSYIPVFYYVKLLSCSSFRVYARYIALIYLYFRTETILSTTCNGVYFGFELLYNRVSIGGENAMKFSFV
jgi:ribosomal protein S8